MNKSSLPTVYLLVLGVGFVSGQEQPVPETTGQQEGSLGFSQNVFSSSLRKSQTGEQGEQTPLSGTSEYSEGNENWRSNIFGRNWLDSNATLGNAYGQGRRFWAVQNMSNVRFNEYTGQTPDPDINTNRQKMSGSIRSDVSIGDQAAGPVNRNRRSVAGQSIRSDASIGSHCGGAVTFTTRDVKINIDVIETEGTPRAGVRKQVGGATETTLVSPIAISGLIKNVLRSSIFNKSLRRSIHYHKIIGDHSTGPVTFTHGEVKVDINWNGHDETGVDINVPQLIQSGISIGSHATGAVTFTTRNVNINIDMTENEGTSSAGVLDHGDNNSSQSSQLDNIPVQSIQSDVSIGDYAAGAVTVTLGTININIKMTGQEESSRTGVLNHGGGVAKTTLKSIPQSSLFDYLIGNQPIHSGVSIGDQAKGAVTITHGKVIANINRNGDRETYNSWNFDLGEGVANTKLLPQSSLRDNIASQSIQSDVSIGDYATGAVTVTLGDININIKTRA